MSFFVWVLLGVVIGYLARLIMRCEPDQGAMLSTGAGMLGALAAGWLLARLLGGTPDRGAFSVAVAAALLGAVILIGLVNLLRYRRIR